MTNFNIPKYIQTHLTVSKLAGGAEAFKTKRSKNNHAEDPIVSVVVIAHNEEDNILKCVSSLKNQHTEMPYEIIVVNNNSTDSTQQIIDRCEVITVFEKQLGPGYARQAGMQKAKGKFHLCADADSIYPPTYIAEMVKTLKKENVVGTFGTVSFLPGLNQKRFSFAIYEMLRNPVLRLRATKRPELVVGGANFGFITTHAKKYGWRTDIKRGEDGSMLLNLKNDGKIVYKQSRKSTVWTSARTLNSDGNFSRMIMVRIRREYKRINEYFGSSKNEYSTTGGNKL